MSSAPNTQSTRLDFRLTPQDKAFIERAAAAEGQTVSSFAVSVLLKAAAEAVERASVRTLSARDSQTFFAMLESDAEPNAAMKAAAKRYKARRAS